MQGVAEAPSSDRQKVVSFQRRTSNHGVSFPIYSVLQCLNLPKYYTIIMLYYQCYRFAILIS
jgi:hypothetical protein